MEKLGIELPLLLTQLINFTIIVFLLTKILYKPILKVLDERKKRIEEGLAFTDNAKKEQQNWEKKKNELTLTANDEARVIIEEARKEAKRAKEEILKEGKDEVLIMKNRFENEVKTRLQEQSAEIASYTIDIAAEMVKKLLPRLLDDKNQHKIIIQQLQQIEKTHGKP